jgi:dienelactone hydrolase
MKLLSLYVLSFFFASALCAEIVSKPVAYMHDKTALEGIVVYDSGYTDLRPGVMVVPQWRGISDYEKRRAQELAELGYVVFIADMYGKGIRPKDNAEAGAQASIYKKDRALMRARAHAGMKALRSQKYVDLESLAAIGYCFGGTVALELARSGEDLDAVVSFHGNLDTPNPKNAENINAKVMVLHGANDPYVSWDEVSAFRKEMQAYPIDWQLIVYGNAVHAFSQEEAGDDASTGAAYNSNADVRSFQEMQTFLEEVFVD